MIEYVTVSCGRCEDRFPECLQLVEDQRLFKEALPLFSPASNSYQVPNRLRWLQLMRGSSVVYFLKFRFFRSIREKVAWYVIGYR